MLWLLGGIENWQACGALHGHHAKPYFSIMWSQNYPFTLYLLNSIYSSVKLSPLQIITRLKVESFAFWFGIQLLNLVLEMHWAFLPLLCFSPWSISYTLHCACRFLNVRNHRNQYQALKPRLPLANMDENAMDANMDELLDLCTGKFTSQAEKALPGKRDKKENMEELLNLCSGKFASQGKYPTKCIRFTMANYLKPVSLKRSSLLLGEVCRKQSAMDFFNVDWIHSLVPWHWEPLLC